MDVKTAFLNGYLDESIDPSWNSASKTEPAPYQYKMLETMPGVCSCDPL